MERPPRKQASFPLLLLPPEIRIIIYDYLVLDLLGLVQLRWKPRARFYKGTFGLILTCRLLAQEVEPRIQAYMCQSAQQVSYQHLDKYMGSKLRKQYMARELRITIDVARRFMEADLLPLVHLKAQYPDHRITFITVSESQELIKVVDLLSRFINELCAANFGT